MALIFSVSATSQPPLSSDIPDKVAHAAAYTGLGLTVLRAIAGGVGQPVTRRVAVLTVAITVAYGISDEVHQMFVPNRTPEIADVGADALGAVIAVGAGWLCGIIGPFARRAARKPQ